MPLHDWTRLDAGIFHSFHLSWIGEIVKVLNNGLLPDGYYSLGEQVAGGGNPDVLALHEPETDPSSNGVFAPPSDDGEGGTALLTAAPKTRIAIRAARENYTRKQRRIVIRHISGHRIVALIEIVSAGNKSSEYAWRTFVDKALGSLYQGIHLLILDLHPPTPRDPSGVHGALWDALAGEPFELPADADRTLAAYSAGPVKTAYVEPVAVGQSLRDMPLFLTAEGYIEVPLEATYQAAFTGVPKFYRDQLQ
jgi:hypothetical protein